MNKSSTVVTACRQAVREEEMVEKVGLLMPRDFAAAKMKEVGWGSGGGGGMVRLRANLEETIKKYREEKARD